MEYITSDTIIKALAILDAGIVPMASSTMIMIAERIRSFR